MSPRNRIRLVILLVVALLLLHAGVPMLIARFQLRSRSVPCTLESLIAACHTGDAEVAGLLLRAGVAPDQLDRERLTPLLHATNLDQLDIVRLLLEAGANPDWRGKPFFGIPFLSSEPPRAGTVPLVAAATAGKTEMVRLLVENGAHRNRDNAQTALWAAVQHGHAEISEILVKAGVAQPPEAARPGRPRDTFFELAAAVRQDRADVLRTLLPTCRGLDRKPVEERGGFRLLALAAHLGHAEPVRVLAGAGADPSALDSSELAACIVAAAGGRRAGVQALLEAAPEARWRNVAARAALATVVAGSADVAAALRAVGMHADEARDLALAAAARAGDAASVTAAIEAGADVDLHDFDDRAPLEIAATAGHIEVVRLLLAAGAKQHVMSGKFLRIAGGPDRTGYTEIRALLEREGGPSRAAGREGNARLEKLARLEVDGHRRTANTLKAAQDQDDRSPTSRLVSAAGFGKPTDIEAALRAGADVNGIDDRGITALMAAAGEGNLPAMRCLLQRGADGNARGATYGMTALMLACWRGQSAAVDALIAARVDLDAEDDRGLSAVRIVKDRKALMTRIRDRLPFAELRAKLVAAGARDR